MNRLLALAFVFTAQTVLADIGIDTQWTCESTKEKSEIRVQVQKIPKILGDDPVGLLAVEVDGIAKPSVVIFKEDDTSPTETAFLTKTGEVSLGVEKASGTGAELGRHGRVRFKGSTTVTKLLCYPSYQHFCGETFMLKVTGGDPVLALGSINPSFPKNLDMALELALVEGTTGILKGINKNETLCVEGKRIADRKVPSFNVTKILARKF